MHYTEEEARKAWQELGAAFMEAREEIESEQYRWERDADYTPTREETMLKDITAYGCYIQPRDLTNRERQQDARNRWKDWKHTAADITAMAAWAAIGVAGAALLL